MANQFTDSEGREIRSTLDAALFLGVRTNEMAEVTRRFKLDVLRRKGTNEKYYVWEQVERVRREADEARNRDAFEVVTRAGVNVDQAE